MWMKIEKKLKDAKNDAKNNAERRCQERCKKTKKKFVHNADEIFCTKTLKWLYTMTLRWWQHQKLISTSKPHAESDKISTEQ
jgi:hypothetical protein